MIQIEKYGRRWRFRSFLAILGIFLSTTLLYGAPYAKRTLPASYTPGTSFTVTVEIIPDPEIPISGYILTEIIPWQISWALPNYFKPAYPTPTSTPKWLDSSGSITSPITITYTVNVPANASGTYSFSGFFNTTQTGEVPVLGDTLLSPVTTADSPSFTPLPGTFDSAVEVSLSSETPNAIIYYTLDNTEPSESSFLYTSAIVITSTTTIKAKAYKEGMDASPVSSATYTISEPVNGGISGTISYSGVKTGTLYVEAYTNPSFTGTPVKKELLAIPGNYTLSDLSPQTYYIYAYLDTNNNATYDDDKDPAGKYSAITITTPVILAQGENKTGVSFTIYDPLEFVTDLSSVEVGEGSTALLQVKLNRQPATDLTATLVIAEGGDPDITISSPASKSLLFTTSNWNIWQTVTLSAREDDDTLNGTAVLQIRAPGVIGKDIQVIEQDNDILAILTTVTELQVPEGGTEEFGVRLSHRPASAVTLTVARISGDTDISVTGGATLLFTPDNWDVWQTVTLSAREDDDTLNGTCLIQITGTGLEPKEILATEIDNDILAIVTDLSEITLSEGGSNSLRVRLSHQPSVTVAVMLSITDLVNADIEISSPVGKILTFTSTNWESWQTVLLSAKEDGNLIDGTGRLLLEAEGLEEKNIDLFEIDTTNKPPRKPVPVTPTNEMQTDSLDPLLQASSFQDSDAGNIHSASEWEITPIPTLPAGPLILKVMPSFFIRVDRATGINLTRVQVPWGVLNPDITRHYSWKVRYRDNTNAEENAWSEWSDDAYFQIPAIDPVAEEQRLSSSQLESLKEEVENPLLHYGLAEIVGNHSIGISSSAGEVVMVKSIDPDTLSTQGKPLSLLFGIFSLRIEGIEPGESTIVSFYFPGDFSQYGWYKYSDIEGWSLYPSARTYDKITGYTKIDISLTDGGRGDQDGVENAVIVDPSGPGAIPSGDNGAGGGGGGCFIATAAFGSYQEPHVRVLRAFRDRFLLTNSLGKLFVQGYYTYSPGYAAIIEPHPYIRALVRILLLPLYGFAWFLLHKGMILLFLFFFSFFAIRRFCEKR
ncbi:MAG: chitobiase/beta-hexosaminidase C-terminal domain-containing protein [Candidatus Ratteibacteria bacterium]